MMMTVRRLSTVQACMSDLAHLVRALREQLRLLAGAAESLESIAPATLKRSPMVAPISAFICICSRE
ncbi:hypothetical protein SRIMM317S_04868 [Streptomyces rimosus subsp. rimosus]